MRFVIFIIIAAVLLSVTGCYYGYYYRHGYYPRYTRASVTPHYYYDAGYYVPDVDFYYYNSWHPRYYTDVRYYPSYPRYYTRDYYPSRYYSSGGRYYRTPTALPAPPASSSRSSSFLRKLR